DLAGARPYYAQALAICEARLGAEHPTTRTIRANLATLDAPPQTREQQIAAITGQADAAVAQALADPTIDRAALAAQLEAVAGQAEAGEAEGSPYLALAAHLRELKAQLDTAPDPAAQRRADLRARAGAAVAQALTDPGSDHTALIEWLAVVADSFSTGSTEDRDLAAYLRALIAKLSNPGDDVPPTAE
ncbi:MAG TPA: hypothetical protein VF897_25915, partial [Roseiflexaceae bacterium]